MNSLTRVDKGYPLSFVCETCQNQFRCQASMSLKQGLHMIESLSAHEFIFDARVIVEGNFSLNHAWMKIVNVSK